MLRVEAYRAEMADEWDALVASSFNGTFLHSRRFLAYHGDRFADRSLVVRDGKQRLVAVFPAALDPSDMHTVVSHPGATFGGLVHGGLSTLSEAFQEITVHYREAGLKCLIYKAVPHIYHRVPAMEDLYELFRRGATCFRRDLSACIDLKQRQKPHQLRRRGVRKAEKAGVRVTEHSSQLAEFWQVLGENLAGRHDARPVHSLTEITTLLERFADMELVTAGVGDGVDAGCLLFKTVNTTHCQYLASSAAGRESRALDLILETLIERETAAGKRFFNFGISTENQGRTLNQGLHQFKNGFGGGTIVHEFFRLEL